MNNEIPKLKLSNLQSRKLSGQISQSRKLSGQISQIIHPDM